MDCCKTGCVCTGDSRRSTSVCVTRNVSHPAFKRVPNISVCFPITLHWIWAKVPNGRTLQWHEKTRGTPFVCATVSICLYIYVCNHLSRFFFLLLSLCSHCSLQKCQAVLYVMPGNPLMSPVKKYMSRDGNVYLFQRKRGWRDVSSSSWNINTKTLERYLSFQHHNSACIWQTVTHKGRPSSTLFLVSTKFSQDVILRV